ncbi:hypothetical protein KM866_09595 [Micrococcus luteus]|nr:hypothetical protein [Micrococcus luteus]
MPAKSTPEVVSVFTEGKEPPAWERVNKQRNCLAPIPGSLLGVPDLEEID